MIVTHVLSLVVGALVALRRPGLGARDRRPAPGGQSPPGPVRLRAGLPARGAPAAEQCRGAVAAPAVRTGCPRQPAAGLDDLHDGWPSPASTGARPRPHLVAGLRDQRLLHHHHGLLGAQRGRAGSGSPSWRRRSGWASSPSSSATCPPSTAPTTAARRARTGSAPSPDRHRTPQDFLQTLQPCRRPREPRHLAERRRLDARPRADPHRLPDPHLLPRVRPRAIVGRHHGGGARRVGAGLRRLRRWTWARSLPTPEKGPADRPRLRPPSDRADRPGRLHPAAPADAAPGPLGAHRPAGSGDEHQPGRVRRRPGGPVGDPRRRRRATRRRRGAGSPGSDPPTTPRCGPWPGSPWPLPRPGRPTVRRWSASLASFAGARCTSTGPSPVGPLGGAPTGG